jgi:O-antigen/teichoic acid export membrane protein
MRIFAIALLATFLSYATGAILLVLRAYRELVVINAIALVVIVVLALALVPDSGAKGGAVAVLVGEWLVLAAQAVALRRAVRRRPGTPLPSGV